MSAMTDEKNGGPDGLAQLQAMLDGGLKAPIGQTPGFELVEVEPGRVVFAEAELHGEGRLCATATSTLLVFDVEPRDRGALQA